MDFEADRESSNTGDPSLAEMTRTAIRILQNNSEGFFLFVEGGRIDHAHHFNNAYRALDETLAMEAALLAAMELVDPRDTLFIVTADHSHVMTFGGHATPRGHPVLGPDSKVSDVDGQPYTTILYGNGPGYSSPRPIPLNVSTVLEDKNGVHGAAVPRKWATHGGEDVPVYAIGPLATILFSGTIDQTYVPHAIAYAACLGPHAHACNDTELFAPSVEQCAQQCAESETRGVADNHPPVVIASSVMVDESVRTKEHLNVSNYISANYLSVWINLILVHISIT